MIYDIREERKKIITRATRLQIEASEKQQRYILQKITCFIIIIEANGKQIHLSNLQLYPKVLS
jgi:hypothetical protein